MRSTGRMSRRWLSDREMAAYDAPFHDRRFQVGARAFPNLVMVEPQMDGVSEMLAALRFWREEWSGRSFMAIGARDPDVGAMQALCGQIRDCPEPVNFEEAGHFVPEWGEPVARAPLRAFGDQ